MCGSCAAAPTCATTPTAIATGSRPAPPPPPRTPAATRASAWPQTREARRLTADAAGPQGTADAAGPQDTADAAGPQDTADAAGPQDTADAAGPQGGRGISVLQSCGATYTAAPQLLSALSPRPGRARLIRTRPRAGRG